MVFYEAEYMAVLGIDNQFVYAGFSGTLLWLVSNMAVKSLEEVFGDLTPKVYELKKRLEEDEDEDVIANEVGLLIKELYAQTNDIGRASIASFYPEVRSLLPEWLYEADLIRHDHVMRERYDMRILKKGMGLFPFLEQLVHVDDVHPSDLAQVVYTLMEYDKEKDELYEDISQSYEEIWRGHEIRVVVAELLGYLHKRLPQSAKQSYGAIAEASCRYLLGVFQYRIHELASDFYNNTPDLFKEAESLLRHARACDPGANVQDLNARVREIPILEIPLNSKPQS